MPNSREEEIIDLTSFDYYTPCSIPRHICNAVIDLANESFSNETNTYTGNDRTNLRSNLIGRKKPKAQDGKRKTIKKTKENSTPKEELKNIGLCSICWDKLGKNPLASTKCGHVFCLACLESCLKCDSRCPTCRRVLRGASGYHPLYLELG